MAKYFVKVTERISRYVEVEAPDTETAEEIVKDMYSDCEIILDSGDYLNYAEFDAITEAEYKELLGE